MPEQIDRSWQNEVQAGAGRNFLCVLHQQLLRNMQTNSCLSSFMSCHDLSFISCDELHIDRATAGPPLHRAELCLSSSQLAGAQQLLQHHDACTRCLKQADCMSAGNNQSQQPDWGQAVPDSTWGVHRQGADSAVPQRACKNTGAQHAQQQDKTGTGKISMLKSSEGVAGETACINWQRC